MDFARLITVFTQAGSFIAAFAAITAGVIMANVMKKFGTGILASNFKSISIGVFFIAFGILIDAIQTYLLTSADSSVITVLIIAKELLFVIGTYTIVVASKKTGDKLESLTK